MAIGEKIERILRTILRTTVKDRVYVRNKKRIIIESVNGIYYAHKLFVTPKNVSFHLSGLTKISKIRL